MTKRNFMESIKEDFNLAPPVLEETAAPTRSRTRGMNNARLIPIGDIIPDPDQPRTNFDQGKLDELAESIKSNGILEPISVRFVEEQGVYQIMIGERRHRAAKIAGLAEIPCIIKNLDGQEALILQMIENLQRENLTPIEEANSIKRLVDSGLPQTEISKQIGKSQSFVSLTQKLLTLPQSILEEAGTAKISKDELLQLTKAENPEALWQQIKQGKTAREIKNEVKKGKTLRGRPKNFKYRYNPRGKPYRVTVEFRKPHAEDEEIRAALNEGIAFLTHIEKTE